MDVRLLPLQLETERLLLQKLKYEDAEEIFYTYASKPEATKFVSWKTHERMEDTNSYLRYAHAAWIRGDDYSFAIRLRDSNRLIGSIGVLNRDGDIQFGYILSPTQWSRGYATEAAGKIVQILATHPAVRRLGTFADAENSASLRVLEKIGLQQTERKRKYFRFPNLGDEMRDCVVFSYPLPGQSSL